MWKGLINAKSVYSKANDTEVSNHTQNQGLGERRWNPIEILCFEKIICSLLNMWPLLFWGVNMGERPSKFSAGGPTVRRMYFLRSASINPPVNRFSTHRRPLLKRTFCTFLLTNIDVNLWVTTLLSLHTIIFRLLINKSLIFIQRLSPILQTIWTHLTI